MTFLSNKIDDIINRIAAEPEIETSNSNSESFINKTNINYNIPMLKYKILAIAIKKFS